MRARRVRSTSDIPAALREQTPDPGLLSTAKAEKREKQGSRALSRADAEHRKRTDQRRRGTTAEGKTTVQQKEGVR
jgi:hypothetical protein